MAFIKRCSLVEPSMSDLEENRVRDNRDPDGAIDYAIKYAARVNNATTFDETTVFNGIKAIGWLIEANTFFKNNEELAKRINLDIYFRSFSKLHCAFPFLHDAACALLPALIRNTTIKEIDLSHKVYDFGSPYIRFANEHFSTFIQQTNSLKILNLSERAPEEHQIILKQWEIQRIADGLRLNSSIEELYLEGQPLFDTGIKIILDALANNPQSKISKLNIINTGMTDAGATLLLNFLKKYKTISSIDLVPELDSKGNQFELSLVSSNRPAEKGKLNLAIINTRWIKFSFISCYGNLISNGMEADKYVHQEFGFTSKDLVSPDIEVLRSYLPRIIQYFVNCGYLTRINNSVSPQLIHDINVVLEKNKEFALQATTQETATSDEEILISETTKMPTDISDEAMDKSVFASNFFTRNKRNAHPIQEPPCVRPRY